MTSELCVEVVRCPTGLNIYESSRLRVARGQRGVRQGERSPGRLRVPRMGRGLGPGLEELQSPAGSC